MAVIFAQTVGAHAPLVAGAVHLPLGTIIAVATTVAGVPPGRAAIPQPRTLPVDAATVVPALEAPLVAATSRVSRLGQVPPHVHARVPTQPLHVLALAPVRASATRSFAAHPLLAIPSVAPTAAPVVRSSSKTEDLPRARDGLPGRALVLGVRAALVPPGLPGLTARLFLSLQAPVAALPLQLFAPLVVPAAGPLVTHAGVPAAVARAVVVVIRPREVVTPVAAGLRTGASFPTTGPTTGATPMPLQVSLRTAAVWFAAGRSLLARLFSRAVALLSAATRLTLIPTVAVATAIADTLGLSEARLLPTPLGPPSGSAVWPARGVVVVVLVAFEAPVAVSQVGPRPLARMGPLVGATVVPALGVDLIQVPDAAVPSPPRLGRASARGALRPTRATLVQVGASAAAPLFLAPLARVPAPVVVAVASVRLALLAPTVEWTRQILVPLEATVRPSAVALVATAPAVAAPPVVVPHLRTVTALCPAGVVVVALLAARPAGAGGASLFQPLVGRVDAVPPGRRTVEAAPRPETLQAEGAPAQDTLARQDLRAVTSDLAVAATLAVPLEVARVLAVRPAIATVGALPLEVPTVVVGTWPPPAVGAVGVATQVGAGHAPPLALGAARPVVVPTGRPVALVEAPRAVPVPDLP